MFMRAVRILICFGVTMFVTGLCFGDDTGNSFFAPEFRFTLFGGAGSTNQSGNATHGSLHLGGSLEVITAVDFEHKNKEPFGLILEFGYEGPVNELGAGSALLSVNYAPELVLSNRKRLALFATAGYTRLFGTGNALNYGGGLNFYNKGGTRALRIEVRDYLRFAGIKEHSVALRIGYLFCGYQQ
jgi:hypothetical protein